MDEKLYHDEKCVRIINNNYLTTQWIKVGSFVFNINHIICIGKFKDKWAVETTYGKKEITEEEYKELMKKIKEQTK